MKDLKITFIGAGNMAEALVAGLINHGHIAKNITLSDVSAERLHTMVQKFDVQTTSNNTEAIAGADTVVLAVKPQQIEAILTSLGALVETTTFISIAAGKSIASLQEKVMQDHIAWVRAMPNTPALLGAGMSVLFSQAATTHCDRATYIFNCAGETAWVKKEHMMNAVTAISGSGPAYFFLLAELMQGAGETLGLPAELAGKLAAQTALGAGKMLKESGRSAAVLREQVSSPGGTTLAALDCMFEKGIADAVRSGVRAADRRSRELS
ncbi:MAG: pyrroline-5-carboxylate reductase [Mariprofundaceae bacterium]|nr:pyrroline-5-carboxylate reductase [Mariprofundaceae bacterium]